MNIDLFRLYVRNLCSILVAYGDQTSDQILYVNSLRFATQFSFPSQVTFVVFLGPPQINQAIESWSRSADRSLTASFQTSLTLITRDVKHFGILSENTQGCSPAFSCDEYGHWTPNYLHHAFELQYWWWGEDTFCLPQWRKRRDS